MAEIDSLLFIREARGKIRLSFFEWKGTFNKYETIKNVCYLSQEI